VESELAVGDRAGARVLAMRRPTAQEKHQEEALRKFQDAVRQHAQASEVLERAEAVREKTEENLKTARLTLRRVSDGSI
jgi:hypothetical protein